MNGIIELVKVIILGIVEGITEWLPISSTGHMRLVDAFMPLQLNKSFTDMFFVVIQLGAILAVMVVFFHKLNPLSPSKSAAEKKNTWLLWSKVIVATMPAFVLGFLLDDLMDQYFDKPWVYAITFTVYGLAFIWVESGKRKAKASRINSLEAISYKDAALMGLWQCLALVPGTSRSGATIIGALLMGTKRYVATEFSFFMSIPVMFGASFLKLVKFGFHYTAAEATYLILGMLIAFGVSLLVINFLLGYIKKHDFKVFGYYRVALGILVAVLYLLGVFKGK